MCLSGLISWNENNVSEWTGNEDNVSEWPDVSE